MKRLDLHILVGAAIACLPLMTSNSLALDLTPKRGGGFDPCYTDPNIKGANEHLKANPELAARCAAAAKVAKPAASGSAGGSTSAAAGGATSGSSEHSSVRGTINGGGDFIAPKLNEPAPKPRGVAPRPKQ